MDIYIYLQIYYLNFLRTEWQRYGKKNEHKNWQYFWYVRYKDVANGFL